MADPISASNVRLLMTTELPPNPNIFHVPHMLTAEKGPWYRTATSLKKAVVLLSIILSAMALILGAFASLDNPSASMMRGMFRMAHAHLSSILPYPSRPSTLLTTQQHANRHSQIALIVSSIIVNAISISLSAVTSLDWQKKSTHEKKFAEMLTQTARLHVERMSDSQANVVITNRYGIGISATASSKDLDGEGQLQQGTGEKKSA
jgi:hypothetical protein